MLGTTTRRIKTAPVKQTCVKFDATTHRNRYTPAFAAGLAKPTRWTGQHAYASWTAEDLAWAEETFLIHRAAELDAEEDAYNAMLDHLAFEDAAVSRLSRGHCL